MARGSRQRVPLPSPGSLLPRPPTGTFPRKREKETRGPLGGPNAHPLPFTGEGDHA